MNIFDLLNKVNNTISDTELDYNKAYEKAKQDLVEVENKVKSKEQEIITTLKILDTIYWKVDDQARHDFDAVFDESNHVTSKCGRTMIEHEVDACYKLYYSRWASGIKLYIFYTSNECARIEPDLEKNELKFCCNTMANLQGVRIKIKVLEALLREWSAFERAVRKLADNFINTYPAARLAQ